MTRPAGDEARLAAAGEEPEARAEQEDHVRAVPRLSEHGERPEAAAREQVVAGNDPLRLRVGDDGDARLLGEGAQLRRPAREPHAAARHDDRALGLGKPGERPLDRRGGRGGAGLGAEVGRDGRALLVDAREEHVDRDLEEHRARAARGGDAQRLGDQVRDAGGLRDAVRPLRDRLHERQLVEAALQRERLGVAERRRPADEERRDAVEVGVRDGGHDVGHARARRHHRHPDPPGRACPAVGGVPRGLLVPRVDEAQPSRALRLVGRVQVTAVQGEDLAHAVPRERARQELSAVDARHGACRSKGRRLGAR